MARRFFPFVLAFLAVVPGAMAQPSLSPPKAIWDAELNGGALHLQSGLSCPVVAGDFRRNNLQLYDKTGFDVGCDYRAIGGEITLYLTRINPMEFDRHFATAKEAIENRFSNEAPRESTLPSVAGFEWKKASYTLPEHGMITEVMMAPFHGWSLKFRISYRPGHEAPVGQALAILGETVLKSAGANFMACESSSPRSSGAGRLINDNKDLMSLALLTGAMMGTVKDVSVGGAPAPRETAGLATAVLHCAADGFSVGDRQFVYWRDFDAQGQPVDRITSIAGDITVFLQSVAPLAAILDRSQPPSSKYAVVIDQTDRWDIAAFFDGLPDMNSFATSALLNESGPIASVKKAGNQIQFYLPAASK